MRHDAVLAADSWFSALPRAQRDALLARAHRRDLAAGDHVYRLGDPPNGLHAVVRGRVRLVSYPAAGEVRVDMIVKPGRWFGELSVIDGKERPHDAIAAGAVDLLSVSMGALADMARSMPELWHGLALLHCAHHRLGMRETARIRAMPGVGRLAAFLSGYAEGATLRATQDELARIVGVSRQRVNGLLHQLAAAGLVATGYGRIAIRDRVGLTALVEREEHR